MAKTVKFIIANGSGPTGRLLRDMLEERGVDIVEEGADAIISYGVPLKGNEKPVLNAAAGGSKLTQLQKLIDGGVSCPLTVRFGNQMPPAIFPALARKEHHKGGTDIVLVMQPEDIPVRQQQGYSYLTKFLPVKDEFRVWVYRQRHLGTYKKFLKYPEKYRRIGRNYDNGFAFELVKAENLPMAAIELAGKAVAALGLDFGAVDILQSTDDRFYVLEVNTAPGVQGENRQVAQGLVAKFEKWVKLGFPKRHGAR